MKNKKKFLIASTTAVAAVLAMTFALVSRNTVSESLKLAQGTQQEYEVTLNSYVFGASGLTTSYQENVTQLDNDRFTELHYSIAKKDANNNLVLAPTGRVYNYGTGTYGGRITNVKSVKVNYSGENAKLFVQEGMGGNAETYGKKVALVSGTEYLTTTHPNYIMISNSDAVATITSIKIVYYCSEAGFSVERLSGNYTCKNADGDAFVVTFNGNQVMFGDYPGTITVDNSGNFQMILDFDGETPAAPAVENDVVLAGYINSTYKTLTITNKTGDCAEFFAEVGELNRVYVMDDFEDYTKTGTGYLGSKANTMGNGSGLRGAYVCDYNGGGYTSWVKSSGFNYAQSEDYLNLTTAVKHGGSKAATVKGWKDGWTRMWSREAFDGYLVHNFGSGNRFSFWAHGAYTDTACTTASSKDLQIRVQVYYERFEVTDSNRNSTSLGTGPKDFTIKSGSDWKEYTISLDSSKSVYAVNIMVNNSGLTANVFMPVDDFRIYTEPVFEPTKAFPESATNFTKSYHGSVTLATGSAFTVKVAVGANGYAYGYAGANMDAQGYTVNGNTITINTTGTIKVNVPGQGEQTFTYGNWEGTLSNDKSTITIQKANISGTIKDVFHSSVSQVVLTEDTKVSEDLTFLGQVFKRQYMAYDSEKNAYWADSSSGLGMSINSEYHIEGESSLRINPYADEKIRYILNPTAAAQIGQLDSISFWFYVPAGVSSYTIDIRTMNGTALDSTSKQMWAQTYDGTTTGDEGAGWHYVNMGLDKANGYGKNFFIMINKTSAQTILDHICYFK